MRAGAVDSEADQPRIDIRAKFAAPYAFSDDRPPRRRDRLDETDADLARGFGRSLAQQLLQQAMKIGTLEIGLDQSLDMRHDLRGRRNVGSEKAVKIDGRTFGIVLDDRDHQPFAIAEIIADERDIRSEEHQSELQSLMRISYAV